MCAIVSGLLPLALLPIYTREINEFGLGQISLYQSLVAGYSGFVSIGCSDMIQRIWISKSTLDQDRKSYVSSAFCVNIGMALFATLLSFPLQISNAKVVKISTFLIVTSIITTLFSSLAQLRSNTWQVEYNYRKFAALSLGQSLLFATLALYTVGYLGQGASGRIYSQVVSSGVGLVLSIWSFTSARQLTIRYCSISVITKYFKYGLPLLPHSFGIFISGSLDKFVIASILGVRELGIYSVYLQVSLGMSILFLSINNVWSTWLYRELTSTNGAISERVKTRAFSLCCFFAVTSILGYFVTSSLMPSWLNTSYSSNRVLLGLLFTAQLLVGVQYIFVNFLYFAGRTDLLSVSTITSAILGVVLLVLFLFGFGLNGAGAALVGTMFIRLLLYGYYVSKLHLKRI